jgi:AcrR family transcriptional regulator
MATIALSDDHARERALTSAERLFCANGVAAVRMEDVRDASGVSLYRLYRLFESKEQLAIECLRARDDALKEAMRATIAGVANPTDRLLAVFDWLGEWYAQPDFTGCGWINSYGELGRSSPAIAAEARACKQAQRDALGHMVHEAGLPPSTADALMVLIEGATVTATMQGSPAPAAHARVAAAALLDRAAAARAA